MADKKHYDIIEGILEDSIVYIKLFNRELINLDDRNFLKTFTWLILIKQYDNPSMTALSKKLNIKKAQMTSRIDKLVNDGLIERVPDENDRRVIRLALTLEGENFIKKSHIKLTEAMNQLLAPLNPEELEELIKSIEIIKNTVLKIQGV